jgi:hypothetical protein
MPEAKFIREVWAENLEEEMAHLRDLVEDYPYLAMVQFYYIHLLVLRRLANANTVP